MTMNTERNMRQSPGEPPRGELQAPPRLLFWLVIGVFILMIVGAVAGIFVFRSVLLPAQQQRVLGIAPFMSIFLDRVDPNATVPTVAPDSNTTGISPDDLLNMPLVDTTEEATVEAAPPTATAVSVLPTETPEPTNTPTPPPTIAPTAIPTTESADSTAITMASLSGVSVAQAEAAPTEQEVVQESAQIQQNNAPAIPRDARLFGFTHIQQTWNNCGPANITMALGYYSWQEGQEYAASILKPDREDKNVNPQELVAFVNDHTGVKAITRIGGSMDILKQIIAAGFPVLIETGYAPEGYDWIGHYRTVVGYDDNQEMFYVYDSYLGSGVAGEGLSVPYSQFDHDWQAFNRVFIVVYHPDREGEVATILGELADPMSAAEHALEVAQQEARANPQNVYAWFNMGTALAKLGRYEEASAAFDRATQIGLHFRMLWYQFGLFEAYYNVGRYDDVLSYVNVNLNNGGQYVEETYYWQGRALEQIGRRDEAASAYRSALNHNPNFAAAEQALNALT